MVAPVVGEEDSSPNSGGFEWNQAIPQDQALRFQLAAIVGSEPAESYVELRPLLPDGRPSHARAFVPVVQVETITARVRELARTVNLFIGAAPRVRKNGTARAVERVWTLWADLDGQGALDRLGAFQPLPSIVIRTGSAASAHAYWPLREPIPAAWARRANRRLALALGADLASTDAARVLRACGSLNHKHQPPARVFCSRLEPETFSMGEVVGGLRDAPEYLHRPRERQRVVADLPVALDGLARTVAAARPGNRNNALHWAACRAREWIDAGGDRATVREALRDAALTAGLTEQEVEATLRSVLDARAAA
jgi:RepB DNA-primase from phage plasmid